MDSSASGSETQLCGSQFQIQTIDGLTPLDPQIGIFPKKCIPDALADLLFGQPAPSEAGIETAGGAPRYSAADTDICDPSCGQDRKSARFAGSQRPCPSLPVQGRSIQVNERNRALGRQVRARQQLYPQSVHPLAGILASVGCRAGHLCLRWRLS